MNNNLNNESRINKFDKRRKNTKAITYMLIIALILALLFISILIFGNKNKDEQSIAEQNNEHESVDENENNENSSKNKETDKATHDNEEESENLNNDVNNQEEDEIEEDYEIKTEPVEEAKTDDNVIEAYTGNWRPIPTQQSEPHEVVFNKDALDWFEMEQAIRLATGLEEMVIWFIGNGGEQKAIGTVSSKDQSDIFRVYLSWITNEGWLPTKVEKLKEKDL